MNLRQIRYLIHVVDSGMSISKASAALHTSQPSISRHVLGLEEELGIQIFLRRKKRLTGLTAAGAEALRAARHLLREVDNLQKIGRDYGDQEDQSITIAASHTHARYSLPRVVQEFRKLHPKVRLVLRQGDPAQITEWVASGNADLSISAEPSNTNPDVVFFPCYEHHRVILTPNGHPLLKFRRVSLKALADYPLITYEASFKVYGQIMEVFRSASLNPQFVLSATDVDVIKTYVKCGMGIAIVAALAYDPDEDKSLRAINAQHLFPPVTISLGLRRATYVSAYTYDFIELFAPNLRRERIETMK